MINESHIQEQIEMEKRKELLEKHPYKIWQGKDGSWFTYLPDMQKGRVLKKRKARDALEEVVIGYWEKHSAVSFKSLFYQWLKLKLRYGDIKPQTYDRYEADFVRYVGGTELESLDVQTITENMLEDFIRSTIHDQQLTRKSYNGLRTIIRGTFKYAKKQGYTEISISQFFGDLDLSRRIFRSTKALKSELVFTNEEVEMIERYVSRHQDLINLGILLAFQTGLRVGELSALKMEDISREILRVCRTEVCYKDADGNYIHDVQESAKTDAGNREVILTSKAQMILKHIRLINPFGEYLFMEDGERIKEKSFGHRLHVICRELEITERSMHKIRRTCATNMINRGVDESLIISQLGHTAIDCTKHFYYFDNTTLDEAKSQLDKATL